MGGQKRKRGHGGGNGSGSGASAVATEKDRVVADALDEVNAILQDDERSQKETWQIGKRLKRLMEEHPSMSKRQTMDTYFLWGTALARLAAQNEDATLAEAAVDKFQEMHTLSGGEDSAMGPVGYSLWASALLTMATEHQTRELLDRALDKFQQAVDVDGGTTFETRFQYARALKEGGDLVKFLEMEASALQGEEHHATMEYRQYYQRALMQCAELETIYVEVATSTVEEADDQPKSDVDQSSDNRGVNGKTSGDDQDSDDEDDENDDDDDEEEVDPEDDTVRVDDLAEVKLLEAIVHGLLEDDVSLTREEARASFDRTFALFEAAWALNAENPGVLMELASYIASKCRSSSSLAFDGDALRLHKSMAFLQTQCARSLSRVGFEMQECRAICIRKDQRQQEEPEGEEDTDAQVPHLLHALGKALVAYLLWQHAHAADHASALTSAPALAAPAKPTLAALKRKGKKKQKKSKAPSEPQRVATAESLQAAFTQAVEVLRAAHHFHDKLGCYPLACLFASDAYADEEQCRVWLETAETYGGLEDELELEAFASMADKAWFQKYTQPEEQVTVEEEEAD